MIVRDTAGRTIGTVNQVRATANGAVDTVMIEVGDRVAALRDRKSVVMGKGVSVRVDLVGTRIIKKQNLPPTHRNLTTYNPQYIRSPHYTHQQHHTRHLY